ncbi:hypothetical protein H9Q72_014351 [Fusarium xylarioides]|uniref:HTH CENPB-type domain-containing protein n=1 Tax=Fusarium xylarioides TaxID=221167 RepID=A0A9P7HDQ0_9HYPO|nr:hypothetical protein H9Q72_014351 [Fusarium xylarioides]
MPSEPQRKRFAITQHQRLLIHHYRDENRGILHKSIHKWAEAEFRRKFSQSTISESLGKKYDFLDEIRLSAAAKEVKKSRQAAFPLLEEAVHEYCQRLLGFGIPVTGEVIVRCAQELWDRMDDFRGLEKPEFSRGWLDGFKSRFSYKRYKKHGESATAIAADDGEAIHTLQELSQGFAQEDQYNADETGLYWRAAPDFTLATTPQRGSKKDKTRITIFPCSNATGTHRLDLWVIGKSKNPRVFGRLLEMIKIAWLPANTTALHQPMDQGIINNLKVYYKKIWLEVIMNAVFSGKNPLLEVTLLHAVQWAAEAWRSVTDLTINNCWVASSLLGKRFGPITRPRDWDESREALRLVLRQAAIRDAMDLQLILNGDDDALNAFVDPPEEAVRDSEEQLLDIIAKGFTEVYPDDEDDDFNRLMPQQITYVEASSAIETLIKYEAQREDHEPGRGNLLLVLDREKRGIERRWREARTGAQARFHREVPFGCIVITCFTVVQKRIRKREE